MALNRCSFDIPSLQSKALMFEENKKVLRFKFSTTSLSIFQKKKSLKRKKKRHNFCRGNIFAVKNINNVNTHAHINIHLYVYIEILFCLIIKWKYYNRAIKYRIYWNSFIMIYISISRVFFSTTITSQFYINFFFLSVGFLPIILF